MALGSMKHLYRRSEQAAMYREILAPHLATVPDRGVFSTGTDDFNQKFAMQIPADEAFELKFLQISSERGADAGTTIVFAVGGLILMGVGIRLSANPECRTSKNQLAEQD